MTPANSYDGSAALPDTPGMTEETFDRAATRHLATIDRFSPVVLLPVALVFGVVGQWLFYGVGLGVNLGIAITALLAAAATMRPRGATVDALDRWIAPAALIFAFLPALRTDQMLLLFDVPAALVLVTMAAVSLAGVRLTRRALDLLLLLGVVVAGRILSGGAVLIAAMPELGMPIARRSGGRIVSIGIGLALALPFLVVFGVLFASADAVFSRAVQNVFDLQKWSLGEIVGRGMLALVLAWLAGGIFLLAGRGAETKQAAVMPRLRGLVTSTAATTMLVALDALFVFFVALQVAYLFGGRDTLEATGLTYSAYARRGFFELIDVTLLAGGVVFAIEVVVGRRTRPYVAAALVLAVATLVVVASAAYRMQLYQAAYGWSEQRFYAFAGIAWLGLGALVAIVLITRDRTRWLLHAGGLLALCVAVGANLVGPSAFVARENLARVVPGAVLPADASRGLDIYYVVSLGDGAVPTIIEYLPRLEGVTRTCLGSYVAAMLLPQAGRGSPWQSANIDRSRAATALHDAAADLRAYAAFRWQDCYPTPGAR
jgi:hypothetical protein